MQIVQNGPFSQPVYQSLLVAVCGGYVWVGTPGLPSAISKASNQSTPPLSSTSGVSEAFLNLKVYFADGMSSTVHALNTSTSAMETLTASSGTVPTFCGLVCNWRGRLVLAGDSNNPQNFYMSRQGDATDWNYSSTDPAAAVAGNLSRSGQIGEPITSLIPYTDDIMLIGCSNSLWMLQGDPADGGSIVRVSDQMGIVGKDAWCVDPQGTLYFVASGGLYSVKPIWEMYSPPQLLSQESFNQFFQQINWSFTRTSMVWDADLHYLYVLMTPASGGAGTHLVYDARSGGLWPQQFPSTQGPFCACRYLGSASPNGRAVLLGGNDGKIRRMDVNATDDDGTAIHSRVTLGPFKPFPEAAILTATTIDLGEAAPGISTSIKKFTVTGEATVPQPDGAGDVFALAHTPLFASTTTVHLNGSTIPFNDGSAFWWEFYSSSTGGTIVPQSNIAFSAIAGAGLPLTVDYTYSTFSPWNVNATLASGPDAYEVTEGIPHSSVLINCPMDRRQKTFRQRLRGGWFSMTLSNSTNNAYFSFESALLEFNPSGRNRERR